MTKIFFDTNQAAVIKVFQNSRQLEREIYGAKMLSKIAVVPKIEKLDRKVVRIDLLQGFLGYQIGESDLNKMIASFFKSNTFPKKGKFSVLSEIKNLKEFFLGDRKVLKELEIIESEILRRPLYPVHGDLQKQNIVVIKGRLGLIDFEHFLLAPKELEICNSLFFSDGNCLDVAEIIKLLPRDSLDRGMVVLMLKFFKLKQISSGMKKSQAEKRFNLAVNKLVTLSSGRSEVSMKKERVSFCYI